MSEEVQNREPEEAPQPQSEPVTESEAASEPDAVTSPAPEQAEAEQAETEETEASPEHESSPEQPTLPGTLPEPDQRLALLEAVVYVADEPLASQQIAEALGWPDETVQADLARLIEISALPTRGVEVRKVAGGYKTFTKAEHHEAVRNFVKSLRPKLKLSLPALETLAVIAYKQPITAPEIQAIRGVQGTGVLHTLLKYKLVATAGRKKIVGKPMLYKTTREFLMQFGLDNLSELPSLKELEELSRAALGEEDNDGQETLFDDQPDSQQEGSETGAEQDGGPEADVEQRGEPEANVEQDGPEANVEQDDDSGSEPVEAQPQAQAAEPPSPTPGDGDGDQAAPEKAD